MPDIAIDKKCELIAEHYQKTYELTHDLWQQRNSLLLFLLATIGLASLLTFHAPGIERFLVAITASGLQIEETSGAYATFQSNFPFGVLQGILLFFVFYLMSNLYHRSVHVSNNYRYLGELEREIRAELGVAAGNVAFTREGDFYWDNRPRLLGWTKFVYIILLALLLGAFFIGRACDDWHTRNLLLGVVDLAGFVPTLIYYIGYVDSSLDLNRQEVPAGVKKSNLRAAGQGTT